VLPASLLLHGSRGVGKQRLALWLGQLLLCESAAAPCGQCQHCRYVSELGHPDLHWFFPRPRLETDAAADDVLEDMGEAIAQRVQAGGLYPPSSGSEGIFVATVRAIVQQASLSPAMARRKVFVIGDAERMVPQEGAEFAANALLKLLEEPSSNMTLIVTSSEPGALLPTIRSRVVSLRVPRLGDDEVRAWLADPLVVRALSGQGLPAGADERVRLAAGAPGLLLCGAELAAARDGARRLLDAASSGSRADQLRLAATQGSSRARGAFSETLDALTGLLHGRALEAVAASDDSRAVGLSRSVAAVERVKELASGNVSPQLLTAQLLREMNALLR
jgi:DNA polymerase-3 subunit delta'